MKINKDNLPFTGERAVEGNTPQRIWLDHIARYQFTAKRIENKRVLDIACGTGYGSKILYDAGAKEIIGIDISKETIGFASAKYKEYPLVFQDGDITEIKYDNNYFDVIACFETIEHVLNQEKALLELRRVLRPDGLLIISSPNRTATSPNKLMSDPPDNSFHTIEYSTNEFIDFLENYFVVLEIWGQRRLKKFFYAPFIRKITKLILPEIYSPEKGNPTLEKILLNYEYRYITVVCRKSSIETNENINLNS